MNIAVVLKSVDPIDSHSVAATQNGPLGTWLRSSHDKITFHAFFTNISSSNCAQSETNDILGLHRTISQTADFILNYLCHIPTRMLWPFSTNAFGDKLEYVVSAGSATNQNVMCWGNCSLNAATFHFWINLQSSETSTVGLGFPTKWELSELTIYRHMWMHTFPPKFMRNHVFV